MFATFPTKGRAAFRFLVDRLRRLTWPPDRTPVERQRRAASLAIVAGAVGVACATSGAAWEASAASGEWQEAVRAQNRVSGRTIEITRYLYEVEAPQAFDLATVTIHAEELERQAAGAPSDSGIREQAATERRTADGLAREFAELSGASAVNKLASDPRYRTGDGGFDVQRRLLDMQSQGWNPGDDPGVAIHAGDVSAARSRIWTALMLSALALSVTGMLVWYLSLRKQPRAPPEVGLGAPAPPATPPPDHTHHLIAGIGLALGVLATVLTAIQIRAGLDENQAFGEAAVHASAVSALAAGGGVRQAFSSGARFETALIDSRGSHTAAAPDSDAARRAAADIATAARLEGVIAVMAAPPRRGSELAAPLYAVVTATGADAAAALLDQHAGVAAAERAGARANTMVIALFIMTVAAVLVDVAAAARARRFRYLAMALGCAVVALIVAIVQPLG